MTNQTANPNGASLEESVRRIPFRRKVLYVVAIWLALFLIAEVGARVGGFLIYGQSSYFLLYGLKSVMADSDPEGHSAAFDGYFKFPPSRELHQYGLFKDPTPIRINAHGFRGPEFSTEKPDSVIRIVCLGGSSTFGFYDRDNRTYPAILDSLLNDSASSMSGRRYEVINCGIPHANSDNLRAMVMHEIFTYDPDMLTIYTGYNDASKLMAPSILHKVLTWVHGHFASYVAFKTLIMKLGGPELPSRWSTQVSGSDSTRVNKQIQLQAQRFEANVEQIVSAAQTHRVRLILIRQAMNITWRETSGLTYREKVDAANQTLSTGGRISKADATIVVHSALMDVLDAVAAKHDLPVVDNIAIVDRNPEFFASYVHLTETANLSLAEALQSTLKELDTPQGY